jgi:hypothetical protein
MIRTSLAGSGCLLLLACGGGSVRVADPISDIPAAQQRVISRGELADAWPFVQGTGTLGCVSNAVAFRAQGVTYALNDGARARGYVRVDPIIVSRSVAPTNPLRRLRQDQRMQIFAGSEACKSRADGTGCRAELTRVQHLSDDELAQIEAEGRERSWPPLMAPKMSLDAVLRAGLALCPKSP